MKVPEHELRPDVRNRDLTESKYIPTIGRNLADLEHWHLGVVREDEEVKFPLHERTPLLKLFSYLMKLSWDDLRIYPFFVFLCFE